MIALVNNLVIIPLSSPKQKQKRLFRWTFSTFGRGQKQARQRAHGVFVIFVTSQWADFFLKSEAGRCEGWRVSPTGERRAQIVNKEL